MYVLVRVVVPTRLSADERALFRKLAETLEVEEEGDKGFFGRVKEAFGG